MKKDLKKIGLFLMLIFIMSIISSQNVSAQVRTYRATTHAYKKVNSDGNWTEWSDWEDSDMTMLINFNNGIVMIYSPKTQNQAYQITKFIRDFTDSSGGEQTEFAITDQDGDNGHMRFRFETNGNSQVYIEFKNIMWVYNVRKTN